MTDVLLLVLMTLVLGGGVAAGFVVLRARASLDRRLKRMERRLDELLERPQITDHATKIADELRTQSDELQRTMANMRTTILQRVDSRTESIRPGKQSVEQRTRRAVAQDAHALLTLHGTLPLNRESLALSGYAAAPDTLLFLTTLVASLPDNALVVELGSGVSTVWMAAAANRESRGIRIVSVDHDPRWGAETAKALERLDLAGAAEVRIAPLEPLPGAEDGVTPWYAVEALDGLDGIGLLVVDGPPASTGVNARYPAVPQLADRLAPQAWIVLDDTDRDEERIIGERWIVELGSARRAVVERVLDRTIAIRLDGSTV
ncbi:class I SAM-dependent methyltransferase [Microcella sp.]|uniref:class I SAM-dependent methyltransferase n=1 Tax=Microcella sp. TaxID=1913979 RepID=UPI003F70D592